MTAKRLAFRWTQNRVFAVLLGAAALSVLHLLMMNFSRTYWYDELFSIYCADPLLDFFTLISSRLSLEPHPPFYYLWLHLWANVFGYGIWSTTAMSLLLIGSVLALTGAYAARRGRLLTFVVFLCLLAVSYGFRRYLLEVRGYGLALALASLLSFALVTFADKKRIPSRLDYLALFGAAAGMSATHFFGALTAGSAGAALTILGLLGRDRRLALTGIACGAVSVAVIGAWALYTLPFMSAVSGGGFWIEHEPWWVEYQFRQFSRLVWSDFTGLTPFALALFGGLGAWAFRERGRPEVLALLLCLVFVAVTPMIISFHTPIILARYFVPALAPIYLLLALLMLKAWETRRDWRPATAIGSAYLLSAAFATTGSMQAAFAEDAPWRFTPLVREALARPEAAGCSRAGLRVWQWNNTDMPWLSDDKITKALYEVAVRPTPQTFEPHRTAPPRDVSTLDCPILMWAEYTSYDQIDPFEQTDQYLLNEARLTNKTNIPLVVARHEDGFFILRTDRELGVELALAAKSPAEAAAAGLRYSAAIGERTWWAPLAAR